MRWKRCDVCGDRRPANHVPPYDDVHFGYCPICGNCLGIFMRASVAKIWNPVPPHSAVGIDYYLESAWGDYYCPRCGRVKKRLHGPKKGDSHAEKT